LRILGTSAVLGLLLTAGVALAASATETQPTRPATVGPGRSYFTDLKLVTQQGEQVRFFTDVLEGRVVLISGFYINCRTICPRQNLILSRVQKILGERLGREVSLVSITVDPLRDTPEKVREYAGAFRAGPGWLFLSGSAENVNWVNYRLGQYLEDPERHRGIYIIGNLRTGLWVKVSPAAEAEELVRQLEAALSDAPGSRP
jgi:protein SCO1/2